MTWEPVAHLSCPELLEAYEAGRTGQQLVQQDAAPASASEVTCSSDGNLARDSSVSAILAVDPGGASEGQGQYRRVLGLTVPDASRDISWQVQLRDNTEMFVPNKQLRSEVMRGHPTAPLLVCSYWGCTPSGWWRVSVRTI